MRKNLWRLAIALVISSSCFLATVIMFDAKEGPSQHAGKEPIATLENALNEVQRKPLQRVIWETIAKTENLYPGEAVRTAQNAEAQLYFKKTGTMIHLDPDSLVVLEENEKGLSLDFLSGNMFVQSTNPAGGMDSESLTVKTGNGEIKLKSADMSLSKNKNGNVDLEVTRGEAELKQGAKKTSLNKEKRAEISEKGVSVSNDRFEVLAPQAEEQLYLNLIKGEKLEVTWKPLPKGYTVAAELGKTREMSKAPRSETAGETGQLSLPASPGRWYMRLVATSADPKQPRIASSALHFTVKPKAAPKLETPAADAVVIKTDAEATTTFKWVTPNKYSSQVLEIATDLAFKQITHRENFLKDDAETNQFAIKLIDGTYYWRVTGFLPVKGKSESLSSERARFTVASKWELKAPTPLAPADRQRLSFLDVQKSGIEVKWQTPPGVERLKLELQQKAGADWKPVLEKLTETNSLRISDLKPGVYQWHVASLDDRGGAKFSDFHIFAIEDMPRIEWAEAQPTIEYEFTTPTPSLRAQWKPVAGEVATYRYMIAPEGDDLGIATAVSTKQTMFEAALPAEGRYLAQIQALNAKGGLIGQSDVKAFSVKHRPLLPAPQWAGNTPEVLKGDGKGNLSLGWDQVEGAERYLMILESPDGSVVDKREVSRTTASLNRLKPGQYQIELHSIDGLKRAGPAGEKRKVEVPEKSDIRAPKIKAMKVK